MICLMKEKGFTLVELMIVVALSGLIGIAVMVLFKSQQTSYSAQGQVSEMQQNLRVAGDRLSRDLRMVGYDPSTKNPEARKPVMSAAKTFFRWFEKEVGHASCYDIRDANLGRFFDQADPVENQKYIEAGGNEMCASLVGKAARKAAEMILESRNA